MRLFGTSGIRGVVGEFLTPTLALDLGLALATQLGNRGLVIVGKDPRTSSDMLESCLVSGLLSGGCDVRTLGVVPTPVIGFGIRKLRASAGVVITASHNPPEYNGIKFFDSEGMAYSPELEAEIERIHFERRAKPAAWDAIGGVERVEVLGDYIKSVVEAVRLKRGYKVVVDCANGAGSVATPYILRELGCKVIALNSQLSGLPVRPLEPAAENLGELCSVVRSVGADMGFAHDGDADRAAAVDEKGRVVEWDKLLALMCAHVVKKTGGKVVTTVDASMVVDEQVRAAGGEVIRTRVGDVAVARAVKESGAVFGGEPSGAWIFGGVGYPDGPLACARVLEMVDGAGKTLSELADGVKGYPIVRKKFECREERKAAVMKKVSERAPRVFKRADVTTTDGIRLSFEDGSWVLVRPSGTEPYIRVTAQGRTSARAKEIAGETVRILKSVMRG